MLRKKWFLASLLALLVAAFAMPQAAVAAKNFKNLAFMGGYVERHPTPVRYWNPWMERAKQETNGELTFNYFSSTTLYPEKEAFAAVSDGRTDFGVVRASAFPGSMNLMSAMDLAGVSPNAIVGSLAGWDLIQEFPEVRAEFPQNTLIYTCWASASYQIHSIKPIRNLAELKSKKIIVWDATTLDIVKSMGANPVRMVGTDSYLALSKAMADGVFCPIAPIRSMKISDAAKYHLMLNMGTGSFNYFVNKTLWDSMPAHLQKWLTDNGGKSMALGVGKSLEDGQKDDIVWMQGQGHEFIYPSDKDREAFLATVAPLREAWVKDCVSRGFDEALVRKVLKFAIDRSNFYTDEVRKGVYGDYKI